jgi:hypothetical protein
VACSYFLPLLVVLGISEAPQSAWVDGYLATAIADVDGVWLEGWLVFAAGVTNIALFQAEMASDAFQVMGMDNTGSSWLSSVAGGSLLEGKSCRGNVVIFRLQITKRSWRGTPTGSPLNLLLQMTEDANFQFEYELQPICKAEIAQMLHERTKALEENAFTRRTWRSHTRRIE